MIKSKMRGGTVLGPYIADSTPKPPSSPTLNILLNRPITPTSIPYIIGVFARVVVLVTMVFGFKVLKILSSLVVVLLYAKTDVCNKGNNRGAWPVHFY